MNEWIKFKKEFELYQKEQNSIWHTSKPLFCKFTKKQIDKGYMIKENDGSISICSTNYFFKKLMFLLFSDNEFIYIAGIESDALPVKITVKKERNKMTNSLRYSVLKKYNFKCSACGKSVNEVKLQIDHIIPVSKGGKTEISNLQTLCEQCNSGKSNRY